MPIITPSAADLVRTLAEQADLPPHGGLRIVVNPATNSLSMGLVAGPAGDDIILDRHAARVFLTADAADRLRGLVLHAEVTDTRAVFFLADAA
jgi:hypothetical protein